MTPTSPPSKALRLRNSPVILTVPPAAEVRQSLGAGGRAAKGRFYIVDIVWLRDDFRLDDQPALAAAAGRPALTVYVHDPRPENGRPLGGAARWRLDRSLAAFAHDLAACGGRLDVIEGEADRAKRALGPRSPGSSAPGSPTTPTAATDPRPRRPHVSRRISALVRCRRAARPRRSRTLRRRGRGSPSCRAKHSTPRAPTSAAGSPNWRGSMAGTSTRPGAPRRGALRRRGRARQDLSQADRRSRRRPGPGAGGFR